MVAIVASLAVLASLVFAIWQLLEVRDQRTLAVIEANRANQVTEFLKGLFQASDPRLPSAQDKRTLTAMQLLDSGRARLETQLDDQPVTDDGLRQTEAILAEVARGGDELAEQAAYLQARIYQAHFSQPVPEKAAALYRALAEKKPRSHWAQLGLVKLALLQLYVLPEPAGPAARHAATGALLARLTEKSLQRDLHLQLGLAGLFYHQPLPGVLEHLLAADRIGGVAGQAGEDLVVQIAELSFRDGQDAQARGYFERYLREYPVSGRCFTVRARLQALDERAAAAKGARP